MVYKTDAVKHTAIFFFPAWYYCLWKKRVLLLPTASDEREVLGVRSIPNLYNAVVTVQRGGSGRGGMSGGRNHDRSDHRNRGGIGFRVRCINQCLNSRI